MAAVWLPLWLCGVFTCLLASALTALGMDLQKLSHTQNDKSKKPVAYHRQPCWILGFSIFLIAQFINLASMSMAPQVMLSALGATALIFNAFFAWFLLEEKLQRSELFIMFGLIWAVIVVISTTPTVHEITLSHATLDNILSPLFEAYFLAIAGILALGLILSRFAVVWLRPDLSPLSWTLCSAISSGYSVNIFRTVAELLATWTRIQPWMHWRCYATLVAALHFGGLQVYCLNRALKHKTGSAMTVVPTFFSLSILAQLGIAQLVEPNFPVQPMPAALWAFGILSILGLIVLLVRLKISSKDDFAETLPLKPNGLKPNGDALPSPQKRGTEYDPEAFQNSFEGKQRSYTASVTGPLGIV